MMRAVAHPKQAIAALALLAAGCGKSEAVARVVELWHYDFPTAAAPPGIGPEHRTLGAVKEAAGTGRDDAVDLLVGQEKRQVVSGIAKYYAPADLVGKTVILVDDVANTGRTIFYACKPILDILPKKLEVAVLVDRRHKTFPIYPKYVGFSLATTLKEDIELQILNKEEWGVYLS